MAMTSKPHIRPLTFGDGNASSLLRIPIWVIRPTSFSGASHYSNKTIRSSGEPQIEIECHEVSCEIFFRNLDRSPDEALRQVQRIVCYLNVLLEAPIYVSGALVEPVPGKDVFHPDGILPPDCWPSHNDVKVAFFLDAQVVDEGERVVIYENSGYLNGARGKALFFDEFAEHIATLFPKHLRSLERKVQVACEFFVSGCLDPSPATRIVNLVTVLEILAEPVLRSAEVEAEVEAVNKYIEALSMSDETKTILTKALGESRSESISRGLRDLVLHQYFPDGQAPIEGSPFTTPGAAKAFVNSMYSCRSKLVHEGGGSYTRNKVLDIGNTARPVVRAILLGRLGPSFN